ncbi:MAG: DNA integrity scanning diadenylate cyclase DisA [Candidatus Nanoarchaeia archaeon]
MDEDKKEANNLLIETGNLARIAQIPKQRIFPEQKEKNLSKLDILKKLSPGTGLREGLDDILRARHGALIVVCNDIAFNVFEGGFKVNCKFTSKRLAELAKMDGAILLSEDFKKILYANTLLSPDRGYSTIETGTRHQAAERTAKHINGLVIAVSERRGKITVYYKNTRFILQNTEDLLRRATETLQILEKQREVFDELLINMNILEVTNLITISEVCTILQRIQMIKKMSDIINENIVELGKEGVILRMRMRELTKGIEKEQELLIKDYRLKQSKVEPFFNNLTFEGLLDSESIAKLLFGDSSDKKIYPSGYRILSRTSLNEKEIKSLVNFCKSLESIFNLDEEKARQILKKDSFSFTREINTLREQIMIGKKI